MSLSEASAAMPSDYLWLQIKAFDQMGETKRVLMRWAQLGDAVAGVVIAEYIVEERLTASQYSQLRSNKWMRQCLSHQTDVRLKNKHNAGTLVEAGIGKVFKQYGMDVVRDEVQRFLKLEEIAKKKPPPQRTTASHTQRTSRIRSYADGYSIPAQERTTEATQTFPQANSTDGSGKSARPT